MRCKRCGRPPRFVSLPLLALPLVPHNLQKPKRRKQLSVLSSRPTVGGTRREKAL